MSKVQLVVTSKVKDFNKANGGLNTSAETIDALTEHLESLLKDAQTSAQVDGRKTVMKRDIDNALFLSKATK